MCTIGPTPAWNCTHEEVCSSKFKIAHFPTENMDTTITFAFNKLEQVTLQFYQRIKVKLMGDFCKPGTETGRKRKQGTVMSKSCKTLYKYYHEIYCSFNHQIILVINVLFHK